MKKFLRVFYTAFAVLYPFAVYLGVIHFNLSDNALAKLYPAAVSLFFFGMFTYTLFFPPSMIEKFARIKHPDLEPFAILYTRKVTIIWCLFLAFNSAMLLYLAFFAPVAYWTLYSGFISYCLMGLLFVGEYIVRYFVIRKHTN
jgi:uncharacterized membrane protein